MYLQIYSAIWPYIMKCCALKMLWVFLFVIVCISTFLIIMNKSSREDLKKSVLTQDTVQSIHGKINDLKQDLRTKETKLNELEKEILLLSRRRENVKYEIAKQQEEYNKCMQVLLKE
ncbi:uncharacterized protein LOC100679270 isoform X8 [Nasonia vitripennis]|uniref:Uncharacterized protein n=1 Tax=Nasonia vitripennis TaxID=7425 RepID=A0A7M7QIH2_NASVI|nr:uncharacterized protein LOC100679270 isoform X8 [Nasonia vitripennis]